MDKKTIGRPKKSKNEKTAPPIPPSPSIVKKKVNEGTKKLVKRLDFDLPESKLFQKLLEFEKIIDLNLQKRRLEVQAALRQKK